MTNSSLFTAEIVTFRIAKGVSRDDFLASAQGTDAVVRAASGFISRQLSCDSDGLWTDYVIWRDMASAKSAAQSVVKDPSFAPFGQSIDGPSVAMRHADVFWEMPKSA